MRAAWVLFLIGCGFKSPATNSPDAGGPDAGSDGDMVDLSPICSTIAQGSPQFNASACAMPVAGLVRITNSTSFNTDDGTSDVNGLSCVPTNNGNAGGGKQVCVLAASSIIVEAGVVLSAHGSLPFALFGRSVIIQGTIDVASHLGGLPGAGSLQSGCIPGTLASHAGGGRGGAAAELGGNGGDDGSHTMSGATGGNTFSFNDISGGCGGTRGGNGGSGTVSDGGTTSGGAGGGAVWIASLSGDLVFDASAKINASGAGGRGGKQEGEGGAGGGAGGLILLQAPHIQLSSDAVIFANGGHGGGGAGTNMSDSGFTGGDDGTDPTGPASGGGGGSGGLDGDGETGTPGGGDGGTGFPTTTRGQNGTTDGHGGGGGGGGPGAIRVAAATNITGQNVSPPPVILQ